MATEPAARAVVRGWQPAKGGESGGGGRLLRAAVKRALARAIPAVEEHVGPWLGEGNVDRRALCFREASPGAPLKIAAGKGGGRLDAEACRAEPRRRAGGCDAPTLAAAARPDLCEVKAKL